MSGIDRTPAFRERDIASLLALENLPLRGTQPTKKIAILSTPRCGSTYFCGMLASTGLFGRPNEWFDPQTLKTYLRHRNIASFNVADYARELLLKTPTDNGVFSVNIHVGQYVYWRTQAFDLLSLGFDKIFYLRRRDQVAQAYSFAKAVATDQWKSSQERRRHKTPDDILDGDILRALALQSQWNGYYDAHLARHVDREFHYEDFAGNSDIFRTLLRDCGVEGADNIRFTTATEVQRTDDDLRRIRAFKAYLQTLW